MSARSRNPRKQGQPSEKGRTPAPLASFEAGLDRYFPFIALFLTILLFRKFIFSDGMLFGTDTIAAGVFFRAFYADFVRTYHMLPLWDPYIFCGLPFVDAMHGETFYPFAGLKFFMPFFQALGYKLVIHVFLAGITSYHCAKSFKISRLSSAFVGLSWMFAANFVSLVYGGHGGKMYVMTIFPLSVFLLNRAFEKRRTFHFMLLGGSIGLMVLTAHVQMAYHALWGLGLYFLWRLYGARHEGWRPVRGLVLKFVLALGLGVTLAAVQLIPPYIYLNRYSPRAEGGRGYEFATSWSLHPEEVASLVFPDFSGLDIGPGEGDYWGRNFFKINSEYGGVIPLVLAFFAVWAGWRQNLFWVVIAILALIYGLGANTPLYWLFYWLVPGVRVFRAPSLITFIFTFSVALLAGKGLDRLRSTGDGKDVERSIRFLFILISTLAGVALLVTAFPQGFFSVWRSILYSGISSEKLAVLAQAEGQIARGLLFTAIMLVLAFVSVYATRSSWSKNFPIVVLLLSAISVLDLWRIDSRFIQVVPPSNYFAKDRVIEFLQSQEGKFRVFPLPGTYSQNFCAHHRIEEITGHHGNELRRYRELTEGENLSRLSLLNLLNVKYILTREKLSHRLFREVMSEGGVTVYENLEVLPRAFVVHRYELLEDAAGVRERLLDDSFDYRHTILLEEDPGMHLDEQDYGISENEWAKVVADSINSFTIECSLEKPGFLFVSDNFYPSWKASVDGEEAPVRRADYTFMAVALGEGTHRVHFRFVSLPLRIGASISLASLVFLLFMTVRESLLSRRTKRERGPGSGSPPRTAC
jgi:hypothetical protein